MGSQATSSRATWLNGELWRDGEVPPASAAVMHDRGFVLGDGLFETILIRHALPVLWKEHLVRMAATADALHFPLPAAFDDAARNAAEALLEAVDDASREHGTLRITVTRGSGTAFGLDAPTEPLPTVLVRLTPASRRSRAYADRETAWIVDQPRIDPNSLLSGHKTTSSMWRVLAHETARSHGAELALLKTLDGDVAEADSACLFAVIDGEVATPPLTRGILPSTTRGFIIEELAAAHRPAQERMLSSEQLAAASEVIISSSVSGIRPLRALDGGPLPEAAPVAEWLEARYEAIEGGF